MTSPSDDCLKLLHLLTDTSKYSACLAKIAAENADLAQETAKALTNVGNATHSWLRVFTAALHSEMAVAKQADGSENPAPTMLFEQAVGVCGPMFVDMLLDEGEAFIHLAIAPVVDHLLEFDVAMDAFEALIGQLVDSMSSDETQAVFPLLARGAMNAIIEQAGHFHLDGKRALTKLIFGRVLKELFLNPQKYGLVNEMVSVSPEAVQNLETFAECMEVISTVGPGEEAQGPMEWGDEQINVCQQLLFSMTLEPNGLPWDQHSQPVSDVSWRRPSAETLGILRSMLVRYKDDILRNAPKMQVPGFSCPAQEAADESFGDKDEAAFFIKDLATGQMIDMRTGTVAEEGVDPNFLSAYEWLTTSKEMSSMMRIAAMEKALQQARDQDFRPVSDLFAEQIFKEDMDVLAFLENSKTAVTGKLSFAPQTKLLQLKTQDETIELDLNCAKAVASGHVAPILQGARCAEDKLFRHMRFSVFGEECILTVEAPSRELRDSWVQCLHHVMQSR